MNVVGVCVVFVGVVDFVKGKIIYVGYMIFKYIGIEIKVELEYWFYILCVVENDVNVVCFGEFWLGGVWGCGSVFCLIIGIGIGGVMLLNDKLINGLFFIVCEVGYMYFL